jgi:hypothetical protein
VRARFRIRSCHGIFDVNYFTKAEVLLVGFGLGATLVGFSLWCVGNAVLAHLPGLRTDWSATMNVVAAGLAGDLAGLTVRTFY